MRRLLLVTTTLVLGAAAALFVFPGLVLNNVTLRLAQVAAVEAGIGLTWDDGRVEAGSTGVWERRLALSFRNLCIHRATPRLDACLRTARFAMTVDLRPWRLHVVSVGPLDVQGSHAGVRWRPTATATATAPSPWPARLGRWLGGARVVTSRVEIDNLDLDLPDVAVTGRVRLSAGEVPPAARSGPGTQLALTLATADLCLRRGPVRLAGCLRRAELAVRVALEGGGWRLVEAGPLTVAASDLVLTLPAPAGERAVARPRPSPPPGAGVSVDDGTLFRLPALLVGVSLGGVRVRIGQWGVRRGDLRARGRALDATVVGGPGSGRPVAVTVRLARPCASGAAPRFSACFASVAASVTAAIDPAGSVRLATIGPLAAPGGQLQAALPRSRPAPAAAPRTAPVLPPAAATNSQVDPAAFGVPAWLWGARLASVRLEFGSVELRQGTQRLRGRATLTAAPRGPGAVFRLAAHAGSESTAGPRTRQDQASGRSLDELPIRSAVVTLRLTSAGTPFGGPWNLAADGRAALAASDASVSAHATLHEAPPGTLRFAVTVQGQRRAAPLPAAGRADSGIPAAERADSGIPAAGRADSGIPAAATQFDAVSAVGDLPGRGTADAAAPLPGLPSPPAVQRATLAVQGRLDRRGLHADVSGTARGALSGLESAELQRCHVVADWSGISFGPSREDVECRLVLQPRLPRLASDLPLRLPAAAAVDLVGHLRLPLPPSSGRPLDGELTMTLAQVRTPALTADGSVHAHVHGSLEQGLATLEAHVAMLLTVEVARFETLVQMLQDTRYAVPAPLNVLAGKLVATVSGEGDPLHGSTTFPLRLSTRLASPGQSLVAVVAGGVSLRAPAPATAGRPAVDLDVTLTDIQLALPPVQLRNPKLPQLLPDSRINRRPPNLQPVHKPRSPIAYRVRVHTPTGETLRVTSNLAKAPVPIHIDLLAVADQPLTGEIRVDKFPLNLFRWDATVQRFLARLRGDAPPLLDGQVEIVYADYDIQLLIAGLASNPVIKLQSQPPATDRQLGAILLFDRDMSELDDDQLKSADNLRAAAANGALSLATLLLLGSTPVENVGYDPAQNAVTATVAIAKGTSLSIGSDFGQYQMLGVRRRLGHNWSLDTYVERRADTGEGSATAMLEWSRRY